MEIETNNITIKIIGQAGTGKSAICELIRETLTKHNFKEITTRDEEVSIIRDEKFKTDRLANVAKRTHAYIETVQAHRKAKQ